MSSKSIAERLRDLRSEKKLNQDEVSEACGISRIALARYETGTRTPRAEIAARLADYYGVSVDYLLGRAEPAPAPAPKIDIMIRSDMPSYLHKLTPKNRALLEEMARKLLELQQQEENK